MNTTDTVMEFQEMINDHIGHCNELEPLPIRSLRVKLLFEELMELAEASDVQSTFRILCQEAHTKLLIENKPDGDDVNKVEELDALCDIQYNLDAKKITSGLYKIFGHAFEKVHRNNMEKGHLTYEAAIKTCNMQNGSDIRTGRGRFLVYREDGKLLKPWNHEKVNLLSCFIDEC